MKKKLIRAVAVVAFIAAATVGAVGVTQDPGWSSAPASVLAVANDPGWHMSETVTDDPGWSSVGA
ncbi:hypothetical protein [Streptomyces sp. NPDC003943]